MKKNSLKLKKFFLYSFFLKNLCFYNSFEIRNNLKDCQLIKHLDKTNSMKEKVFPENLFCNNITAIGIKNNLKEKCDIFYQWSQVFKLLSNIYQNDTYINVEYLKNYIKKSSYDFYNDQVSKSLLNVKVFCKNIILF
jgi:hypothetical protein